MLYLTLYEKKNEKENFLDFILETYESLNPDSIEYTLVDLENEGDFGVKSVPWIRIRRGEEVILNESAKGNKGIRILYDLLGIEYN